MDEDQSSFDMASSNRKNIKRLLSWSSGSSSTASENEDESKLGWVQQNVNENSLRNSKTYIKKAQNLSISSN